MPGGLPVGRNGEPQPVGGLNGSERLLVGVRLGVDCQPHAASFVIAARIMPNYK